LLHPRYQANQTPGKIACIEAWSGKTLSYAELDLAANQGAQLFRQLGFTRGDVVAVMLDNEMALFPIAWAAERAGLYLTSISTRLSLPDAAYIINDCGARMVIVSNVYAQTGHTIGALLPAISVCTVAPTALGLPDWTTATAACPPVPISDESPGTDMLYSSGTTGRPKGVKPALPAGELGEETALVAMGRALYGMDADMVYLSTSPLYHAAPLRWAMTVHRFGGTIVLMDKFDAERALALIETWRITHSTWVPTHFVRLLKLPAEVRARYDVSSLRAAIHAGAPCPVPIKQAMIEWWGPVIEEYYAGTETCGITALSSAQWLARPGSVGRAVLGSVRILDDQGAVLPAGETGNVYFADGPKFAYHNDAAKTAAAYNERGWATLGDIGRLDDDGYLFLSDRKNFMIISGGVNIYPQEIENLLVTHPKVADAAVVGEPDDEMGEIVIAVVQPAPGLVADATLGEELRQFARAALGGVKTPRRFDFRDSLPREPTGKLLKATLAAQYRAGRGR